MRKVKSGLLRIGLGIIIYLGWIVIGAEVYSKFINGKIFVENRQAEIIFENIYFVVLVVVPTAIFILCKGIQSRCPSCKKMFSMKRTETKLTSRKPQYITVLNNTYSKFSGDITGESEQRILGTRKTYKTIFVCKHCQTKKCKTFSEDTEEAWHE